jgi:hypothetical protein
MILLPALFAAAVLLALGTIAHSLHCYGSRAIALRDELANCPQTRELRYVVREMKMPSRPTARVLVLPVRQAAPRFQDGLRAAA